MFLSLGFVLACAVPGGEFRARDREIIIINYATPLNLL